MFIFLPELQWTGITIFVNPKGNKDQQEKLGSMRNSGYRSGLREENLFKSIIAFFEISKVRESGIPLAGLQAVADFHV